MKNRQEQLGPIILLAMHCCCPKNNESVVVVAGLAFADDAKAVWEAMDASALSNGENSAMLMVRLHSNSSGALQDM
jgi:hypothetical protein